MHIILIYSKDKDEHIAHLKTMLQSLREHQLYGKLKKCEFWFKEIAVLRHVVSKEGIKVDPQKVKQLQSSQGPPMSLRLQDSWV